MKKFTYTPNLTGLNIIKTESEQHTKFFQDGHPNFLIPDFNKIPEDLWTSYMDFLEKEKSEGIWDQDGGEVETHSIIDPISGLTKCSYTAYGISFNSDHNNINDYAVDMEGYVVEDQKMGVYFLVTNLSENS